MNPTGNGIKQAVATTASELGFDACGVVALPADLRRDYYQRWIAGGNHGDMEWMTANTSRRLHPETIVPEARSVLCFGMNYNQPVPPTRGVVARYALGKDYHTLIYKRLKRICALLREYGGTNKPYVDTGPVMEKPLAALAGLGWQGKHTVLIHPKLGNWLFLGVIITTLELPADEPAKDHCGTCTRCITACPTDAITAPGQLDSRRCIAYLTIEHKGSIATELRRGIGDRLFGCDICLEVCPWNRWAQSTREIRFAAITPPDPATILSWNEADFRRHFAGTPVARLGLERLQRNAAVVLGNIGTADDRETLMQALPSMSPLVKEHAEWAVAEIGRRYKEQETPPANTP